MTEYYWEIVKKDGTKVDIPPQAVEVVKRRWNEGQPIHTTSESIPANQIKDFRKTSRPHGQPLLEAAAQAFKEPLINPDGSLAVTWVKVVVSPHEYQTYYSKLPAYKKLGKDMVAFRKPIHEITNEAYCTEEEIRRLRE